MASKRVKQQARAKTLAQKKRQLEKAIALHPRPFPRLLPLSSLVSGSWWAVKLLVIRPAKDKVILYVFKKYSEFNFKEKYSRKYLRFLLQEV